MTTPTFKPAAPPVINPCQDATGKPIVPGEWVYFINLPGRRFTQYIEAAALEWGRVESANSDGTITIRRHGVPDRRSAKDAFVRFEDAAAKFRTVTVPPRVRTDVRA